MAGINTAIPTLTSGFTQETMLVVGQGINHTWDLWGHAMTDLHGKVRPSSEFRRQSGVARVLDGFGQRVLLQLRSGDGL